MNEYKIDASVYNGTRKINSDTENFMTPENLLIAIKSLKIKNCEGFDRIPVRILIDGTNELVQVLSHLFNLIYKHKTIPSQWRSKAPTKNRKPDKDRKLPTHCPPMLYLKNF